jgi:small nuclear ribonucleoprotein (snRNP)-like protein
MSSADKGSQKGGRGGDRGPPRKESILELAKLMDAKVRVKCLGGRELEGTLRGYDDLVNLVLDDCDEFLRGKHNVLGGVASRKLESHFLTRLIRVCILKTPKTWNALLMRPASWG